MDYFIERRSTVLNILRRYKDQIPRLYGEISSTSKKIMMSKNRKVSMYGMFLPFDDLKYCVTEYKGKLTTTPDQADYKYYFDKDGRIVLTERVPEHYIFYFYTDKSVDVVWYHLKRQRINIIAQIQYEGKKICSYMQTLDLPKDVESTDFGFAFYEYTYNYKNGVLELCMNSRYMMGNGRLDKRSKIEKYSYN